MLKGRKLLISKGNRLGSLMAATFDDKDSAVNAGSDPVLESGEELQKLHEVAAVAEEEEEESGSAADIIRQGSGPAPVSVSDVVAAEEKRSDIQYELSQQEINLEKLQRIASEGLPNGGGLRATTWKLLLGYLDPSRNEWDKELIENRLKYSKAERRSSLESRMLNTANAEAYSFSCFVRLLSDSIDHFCQELDNTSVRILSTISWLSDLLRENDEELWRHLEFTTKSKLMNGDFIANLKLLQHYPVLDIGIVHLLQVTTDLSPDTSSYRLSL